MAPALRRGILLAVALAGGGAGLVLLEGAPASVPAATGDRAASPALPEAAVLRPDARAVHTPQAGRRARAPVVDAGDRPDAAVAAPRRADLVVEGFVLDPRGEGAAHARVAFGKIAGRCDGDGRFALALTGPIDARGDLVAWLPGYAPAALRGIGPRLQSAGGRVGPFRLDLGPAQPIWQGRIVDEQGRALKGWRIESLPIADSDAPSALGRSAEELAAGQAKTRSDGAGAFALRVGVGRHRIRVSRGAESFEFERATGGPLLLVLPRR